MPGPIVVNAIVSLFVGILSNLATHYLLRRKAPAPPNGPVLNIVLVWSILPIVFVVVCLLFVQYRWPVSVPIGVTLVVGSFLVAAGVLAGVRNLSQLEKWASRQEVAALLVAGFLVAVVYFQILDQSLPHCVSLDDPGRIRTSATLRGRVIDSSWRVYVLYRPLTSSGAWVVRALPPGEDGIWYANCTFGATAGDKFHVYAVALPAELARSIDPGGPLPEPGVLEDSAPCKTSIRTVTITGN